MSVASYEGPASSNEVGDQRFLYTVGIRKAVEATMGGEVTTPVQTTQPQVEQVQAAGQLVVRHVEIA